GQASSPVWSLPAPALCMSRFGLDALLAAQLRVHGGQLREQARWRERDGPAAAEGFVQATGRQLQTQEDGWRWFGLKVHARQVTLAADLEMHCLPDAYVGLCRLQGEVNVCGLFRRRVGAHEAAPPWQALLRGPPASSLHRRLEEAVFDESSFCAIAGLSLQPRRAAVRDQCCIGDALTMIPPVTGNGMSMAFEAAELAVEPLAAYSRGELPWGQAQGQVAQACDRAFVRRLAWARGLQRLMFAPGVQAGVGVWLLHSGWLWRLLFNRTR
ncbi:MAG TPA: hypothetical protein VNT26_22605, partial [Candidatus Sulfotelmatobacter sp.]|nr:hypothetical protein [Candidatus Sulfotelmatobacter sp.]